ncbi:hypothetical protein CK226_29725 [Mesorhizobium sp. WSM4311]|uniref:phosphoribosyltransferase-like protein n=2 Tax=unclassified Mesorhizobium TaxID=325217 RepID=UPI000BB0B763|nr:MULTISPECIES: hypothetical protein [unclassified Mesorhizobium]PBC19312.1 hypothetical protein CK226_29725 [Mesorhizobium sp. WSM4311]TRD00251.1 hypothetical protein FJV82_21760 [Mesorhizobium sp. WSM4305]
MLDAMLLLNEEQVVTSIRTALDRIAKGTRHRNRRVALYAEREFQEAAIFTSQDLPDKDGRVRRRAIGRSGPPAVKPVRGRARVGSEGLLAFVASQQKDAWPKIFMNHPGPDSLRAKSAPAGEIVIITDFIGSGSRVRSMLDKFWAVPTIRSWMSRKLIKFRVIAAAATESGLASVRKHRMRPETTAEWIAPTVSWNTSPRLYFAWTKLIDNNGPAEGRGCGRYGFENVAALIAFSYRIPNNTPAMVHCSRDGWRALFDGPAPPELHGLFGVRPVAEVVENAAADNGIHMGRELTEEDRLTILVLTLLRGRWHKGSETALSSRTGLPVPTLMDILRQALQNGLIVGSGRLTDKGYAFLASGKALQGSKPIIATNQEAYYPETLRVPR